MPVYVYRCPECGDTMEVIRSMNGMDDSCICTCGLTTERLMTSGSFRVLQGGREIVTNTLNREHKILPPQQVRIMEGGLEPPPKHTIGTGF